MRRGAKRGTKFLSKKLKSAPILEECAAKAEKNPVYKPFFQ